MRLVAIAAVTLLVSTTARADVEWTAGKWELRYEPAQCMMVRTFSSNDQQLSLGFAARPPGASFNLFIAVSGKAIPSTSAPITISAVDGTAATLTPMDLGKTQSGARLLEISMDRGFLPKLLTTGAITLTSRNLNFRVPIGGSAAVMNAVNACEANLLTLWKIDPKEISEVKPQPGSVQSTWVTADDYPREALSARQEGRVGMIWKIEKDGRVEDCRVVESSGSAALDTKSCELLRRRGNYIPSKDDQGHPRVSWDRRDIQWSIPRQ